MVGMVKLVKWWGWLLGRKIGKTIKERVSIYNPMFYLSEHYEGYKKKQTSFGI